MSFREQLGFTLEQRVHDPVVNHTTEPTMNAKPTALDAYLARTVAIHAKLERLRQVADDHFFTTPMPSIGATSATSGGWRPG